jgi:hypothetical protein
MHFGDRIHISSSHYPIPASLCTLLSVAFKQIWALLVPVQRIPSFLEDRVAIFSARERVVFVASQ